MSTSCGGCRYCNFPYRAKPPVKVNGKYKEKLFKSKEDVWSVIDLLLQETEDLNKIRGNDYDPVSNLVSQIPFFTCYNHVVEPEYFKLVNKYVYCIETSTPAHPGSYGEQPASWIRQFFLIKNAFAKKEKQMHDKVKREAKIGK